MLMNSHNEKYQSDDADRIIISSDDISFSAHTDQLKSHSSVLRDMLTTLPSLKLPSGGEEGGQLPEIALCDQDLEISPNVSLFLDLIYGVDLAPPNYHSSLARFQKVYPLIVKYEAHMAIERLKYFL
ncbi:hypothetical protein L486_07788 [Kwoniella mangroviensis CBS 10435]|uniref:BTB domain-containing protein n=1 Tax=Kwoniella mangroviensis CBS 10435 TaxID=1331196 RepID=A0A1B9IGE3_9TREE|nr:hypothetical protein L486_07788 [Kwoniella mangroviensis CBS 10435]